VARPPFEASPAGQRYPPADGVTHQVIRKAAGLWARHAITRWSERHPDPRHLLIGETPFVGNRFVELAHRLDDRAEPLLAGPSCRFVIAVPSAEVRRFLEAQRERRAADPLHPREREDAPPHVLRNLWSDLAAVAAAGARQSGAKRLLVCMDARMGQVYWAAFDCSAPRPLALTAETVADPEGVSPPDGESWFGAGRGFQAYPALAARLGSRLAGAAPELLPRASDIARIAAVDFAATRGVDAALALPVYLRNEVVHRR